MNHIIDITSPSQLPKGKEFYLFDNEASVAWAITSLDTVVYRLTRKLKKEYVEYYVENK